jgi:hypothetical protein
MKKIKGPINDHPNCVAIVWGDLWKYPRHRAGRQTGSRNAKIEEATRATKLSKKKKRDQFPMKQFVSDKLPQSVGRNNG